MPALGPSVTPRIPGSGQLLGKLRKSDGEIQNCESFCQKMLGDVKSFHCGRAVAGFTPQPSNAARPQPSNAPGAPSRADSNSPSATERRRPNRRNSITVKPSARHLLGDSAPGQLRSPCTMHRWSLNVVGASPTAFIRRFRFWI